MQADSPHLGFLIICYPSLPRVQYGFGHWDRLTCPRRPGSIQNIPWNVSQEDLLCGTNACFCASRVTAGTKNNEKNKKEWGDHYELKFHSYYVSLCSQPEYRSFDLSDECTGHNRFVWFQKIKMEAISHVYRLFAHEHAFSSTLCLTHFSTVLPAHIQKPAHKVPRGYKWSLIPPPMFLSPGVLKSLPSY